MADIPVKASLWPENGSEKPIPATSGPTSGRRSEQSALELFSSRTSKATFRLDSPQSSAIWKKMVTKRRGDYSLRQKLALPTGASGSLSWGTPRVTTNGGSPSPQCTGRGSRLEDQAGAAWATPNIPSGGPAPVTGWRGGTAYHNGRKVQIPLDTQVRNWPTVTVMDASGMGPEPRPSRVATNRKTEYLARMVQWPTPTTPRSHDTETTAGQYFPSQNQKDLVWAACMWPTPIARDYKGAVAEEGLIRADGAHRLDQLPNAVRYETLFCRKAASGPSSPPTPAGPQDLENLSTDGNPPEQWPTPRAYSFAESHQPGLTPLDIRVRGMYQDNPRYWASPHANCTTGAGNQGRQGGENLQTQAKGKLNPRWVETLMGLPIGWTMPSCADLWIVVSMSSGSSATASCPQPQSGPSGSSLPNSAGSM